MNQHQRSQIKRLKTWAWMGKAKSDNAAVEGNRQVASVAIKPKILYELIATLPPQPHLKEC